MAKAVYEVEVAKMTSRESFTVQVNAASEAEAKKLAMRDGLIVGEARLVRVLETGRLSRKTGFIVAAAALVATLALAAVVLLVLWPESGAPKQEQESEADTGGWSVSTDGLGVENEYAAVVLVAGYKNPMFTPAGASMTKIADEVVLTVTVGIKNHHPNRRITVLELHDSGVPLGDDSPSIKDEHGNEYPFLNFGPGADVWQSGLFANIVDPGQFSYQLLHFRRPVEAATTLTLTIPVIDVDGLLQNIEYQFSTNDVLPLPIREVQPPSREPATEPEPEIDVAQGYTHDYNYLRMTIDPTFAKASFVGIAEPSFSDGMYVRIRVDMENRSEGRIHQSTSMEDVRLIDDFGNEYKPVDFDQEPIGVAGDGRRFGPRAVLTTHLFFEQPIQAAGSLRLEVNPTDLGFDDGPTLIYEISTAEIRVRAPIRQ